MVEVVDYDPEWPTWFQRARGELFVTLDPTHAGVHHVGSTSVPGLASKPVIDILVEVSTLDLVAAATPALEARGFEARGEYGIEGRRYFSRGAGEGPKVHVHAFAVGHPAIARHIAFRDYLRRHPNVAGEYGELKRALAAVHAEDRDQYQSGKADFVRRTQERALAWARSPDR